MWHPCSTASIPKPPTVGRAHQKFTVSNSAGMVNSPVARRARLRRGSDSFGRVYGQRQPRNALSARAPTLARLLLEAAADAPPSAGLSTRLRAPAVAAGSV